MPKTLRDFVSSVQGAKCWVSYHCFDPAWAVQSFVFPVLQQRPNIQVMLRSVVTETIADDTTGHVRSLTVVTRQPKDPSTEWDTLLSVDLADWYSPHESPRFTKQVSSVSAPVFVEATEFGDVLGTAPFSRAKHRLGAEVPEESSTATDYACQQASTLPFFQYITREGPAPSTPPPPGSPGVYPYSLGSTSWSKV